MLCRLSSINHTVRFCTLGYVNHSKTRFFNALTLGYFADIFKDIQKCQSFHECTKHTLLGWVGIGGAQRLIPVQFQQFSLICIIFMAIFALKKCWCTHFRGSEKVYILYTCENVDIFRWPLSAYFVRYWRNLLENILIWLDSIILSNIPIFYFNKYYEFQSGL